MPFRQTMLTGLAWIFLLRSICQLLSETDTIILFSFHISSAWHMAYHLKLLIISVNSLWLPLRCFQKDTVFFLSNRIFILPDLIYIQAHTHRHINFTITVSISWRWTLAARQNTAHFDPPGLNEQNLLNQRQLQQDNVKDWEKKKKTFYALGNPRLLGTNTFGKWKCTEIQFAPWSEGRGWGGGEGVLAGFPISELFSPPTYTE